MVSDVMGSQGNGNRSYGHTCISSCTNDRYNCSDASDARRVGKGTSERESKRRKILLKRTDYKGFNPDAIILSQCSKKLNWVGKLRWLQPRRDVGLWVQCSNRNCRKWRFSNEYHDPVSVPKKWYCNMNSDSNVASCLIEEKPLTAAIKEDLIENKYNAGSLVLARYKSYPWWPGMVDDSPETFTYYKLEERSNIPIQYHVVFFYENALTHGWISKKLIKPFTDNIIAILAKQTVRYGVEHRNGLRRAYKLAYSAIPLSIKERLNKFSFVARYTKLNDRISPMLIQGDNHDKCQTSGTVSDITSNITAFTHIDVLSSDDEVPSSQYILDLRIQQMTKSLNMKRDC